MRNLSGLLLGIVILGALVSVGISYHKVFVAQAFDVEYADSCDPEIYRCFTYTEECSGKEDCSEPSYSRVIRTTADTPIESCGLDNESCEVIYCDSDEGADYIELLGECSEPPLPEEEVVDEQDDEDVLDTAETIEE